MQMALIEYATDEITQAVLGFCDCEASAGGLTDAPNRTEAHGGGRGCAIFPVIRLLDRALAVQRADIADAIESLESGVRVGMESRGDEASSSTDRPGVAMRNAIPPTSYGELAEVLDALPLLVREARRQRQLGIREAAREIGCSFSTVARFENGKDARLGNALLMLRWLDGGSTP